MSKTQPNPCVVDGSIIRPTTLLTSLRLNRYLGIEVLLASETFQQTGSFKFRGAWYIAAGVHQQHLIGASSGNFGQALAFACQQLGKRSTVVAPDKSASVKINAIKEFGGEVDLVDVSKVSRDDRLVQLARKYPDAYLASGFDDDLMIQGNSTLGKELASLDPEIHEVVTPVSGGGLASGLVMGLREAGVCIPVTGAEPALANHVTRSLREGKRVVDERESTTIADGARRTSLGKRNWEILKDGLSSVIEVPESAIREAVRLLFHLANLKAEPTGALSLAALLVRKDRSRSKRVCCVISGGNVDPQTYSNLLN